MAKHADSQRASKPRTLAIKQARKRKLAFGIGF